MSSKKWQLANPDRTAAIAGKGRAIRNIGEHSVSDIYDLDLCIPFYAEARRLGHEVDHIIPLSRGGLHCQTNLQVLSVFDNRSKGNN
jgi:5-methylcytosine-specific restriction endonuclease McrA